MSYIENEPVNGNFSVADAITTSSTATYALTVGSVAFTPESVNHCIVSLNGVVQAPTNAFTISGTNIVFASALTSSDVIDFIYFLGNVNDIGTVSDGTVSLAKMAVNSIDSDQYVDGSIDTAHIGATQVTGAKLNTDVISAQTALAVAPADTDEFMVSDAGVLKRIDYSLIKGGGITHADQWRINSDASGDGALTANWEQTDTAEFSVLGSSMTESSGIFTFPSTGYWLVIFQCYWAYTVKSRYMDSFLQVTTNNSNYYNRSHSSMSISPVSSGNTSSTSSQSMIVDVTDTANVKVKVEVDIDNNSTVIESETGYQRTGFQFIRLGDT